MNINFPLILVIATFLTGFIYLLDRIFWAPKRTETTKRSIIIEYSRSFFPILLVVLIIRSFLAEPFRIPSGSLEPTLQVGDFILVNKYDYGLRLPVLNTKIVQIDSPEIGDIVVFHWPPDPSYDYIKRIIGVPGDKVSYINKVIYINGKPMPQKTIQKTAARDQNGNLFTVIQKQETINHVTHNIYIRPEVEPNNFYDVVVPDGNYFVMGDNRDDSLDSRFWGFVPDHNLIGKAMFVWFSWDSYDHNVRWNRIGSKIH